MTMSLKSPMSAFQCERKSSHSTAGNGSCFLVRHTPHPRRVCHIKGLNNIPICTVNDDEDTLKKLCGVSQINYIKKDEIPFAKCSHPPNTAGSESPVRGASPALNSVKVHPPRPHSEPCRKLKECFRTSSDNPFTIKKEEIKVKSPPSPPKVCSTAGSCSSELMSSTTNVKENTVCIPNYLDQEIKILAKLCNILRTDSLAEVLQWLLHASSKGEINPEPVSSLGMDGRSIAFQVPDSNSSASSPSKPSTRPSPSLQKEWVSALIHAELAEINLLAHPCPLRRNISAEPAAVTGKPTELTSPSDSPTTLKLLTRSREGHQLTRVSSQGSEENKEVPKEAEHKPPMFIRRNKMTIPVADYFSRPNSLPRPKTLESMSTKPTSARSIQGYNLSPQKAFSPLTYQRQCQKGRVRNKEKEARPEGTSIQRARKRYAN